MNKTFSGRLTEAKLAALIREKWRGNLVVKGIVNPDDAEIAVKHGVDGLIVPITVVDSLIADNQLPSFLCTSSYRSSATS